MQEQQNVAVCNAYGLPLTFGPVGLVYQLRKRALHFRGHKQSCCSGQSDNAVTRVDGCCCCHASKILSTQHCVSSSNNNNNNNNNAHDELGMCGVGMS